MAQYSIEPEPAGDVVRIRVSGTIVVDDAYRAIGELGAHPSANRLWDLREADLGGLTLDDLRAMASASREQSPPGPRRIAALVVADLAYGLSRMFGSLAEVDQTREYAVFRDEAEALAWLRGGPDGGV